MVLRQLSGVKGWLENHPLSSDPFWDKEHAGLSEMDIQLFYARSGIAKREQAAKAIDTLQAIVIAASFKGEIKNPSSALILHETPQSPFMVDELVEGLAKMRPARRQACLFALENHMPPDKVLSMTWADAKNLRQLSPLSKEIIAQADKTRHFKLPYVFWEWATTEIAAPLLELSHSIEYAFGMDYPKLQRKFDRMLVANPSADAAHLNELLAFRA